MKYIRYMCMLLAVLFLLATAVTPLTVAAEDTGVVYNGKIYARSVDVPAIYIECNRSVSVERYTTCTVVAIDRVGGKYTSVATDSASIRVRGNSTSSGPKKPYNIKFSSNVDLFGMGKGKRYCLIANLYDPTLIRNHTAMDFARRLRLSYTPDSMLVDVYYNGKYVGCYQLCEALTDDKDRVDIDVEAGDFLLERDSRTDPGTAYFVSRLGIRFGINEPQENTADSRLAIRKTVDRAEQALQMENYSEVKKLFDIPSMVDFYICLELFKNVDVDCASTRFYCKNGVIYGGPAWDFDLSSGNCDQSYYVSYYSLGDSAAGIWCNCLWFRYLLKFDEFKQAVCQRYLELQDIIINLYDSNVLGSNRIDALIKPAKTSIERNFSEAGWDPGTWYSILMRYPETSHATNVKVFREWLRRRNEWLLSYWGLTDRVYPKPTDPYLRVNGIYISGFAPMTSALSLSELFEQRVTSNAKGEYLGTGARLRGEGASLVAVVDGDLTGEGIVNIADYLLLCRYLNGDKKLSGAYYRAACLDQAKPDETCKERLKTYCIEVYG